MVVKAKVQACERRDHEKKEFSNPIDIEVTGLDLWRQFWKKQNFCFYGPKGSGPDL